LAGEGGTDIVMDRALQTALSACASDIDARLLALLDSCEAKADAAPGRHRLVAAMRHATLGGGKRIRPFLAIETARRISGDDPQRIKNAYAAGAAVELIHCYSLVHDDLPSMDNDLVRRGQPTVHVAFDEATAILAGDAMQTLAFETLADIPDAPLAVALIRALAIASGEAGMVGGQMLDLTAEGRFPAGGATQDPARFKPLLLPLEGIAEVQSLKTGAIIIAAVEMGALCAGLTRNDASFQALSRYGAHLGRAFQIADDIIDATGDAATAGKAVAKDAAAGKATFVSALGLDGARQRLQAEIAAAETALQATSAAMPHLAALARSMASRSA
jgi:farnesyl diphosphate synthase